MATQKPAPSPLQQAYFVIRDLESKVAALTSEPIAIIGMACRFPGGANTPELFWELLEKGRDGVVDVPADRWDIHSLYDPDPDAPGKMYSRQGGFIGPIDQFDARFFGISPREAIHMDPQQRLLLEVSWEALERAGVAPGALAETRTGVFLGAGPSDYAQLHFHAGDPSAIDVYDGTGNASCFTSGRLSYALGLQGPSLMVDTACSSSLVAVHLACRSLRAGECDVALAAGVQLMVTPETYIFLSRARALAPDGRCKPFDASADGYGRGEGCGVIVLKRLSAAQAAGDRILAVIRGSAVNHDGPSSGLTVPNGLAQQALIRSALESARVSPAEVGYVEAHGTGTALGDPIEADALAAVLGTGHSPQRPLWIGSVKSNIGHLEAAAGIAGLMKAVLALKHRTIPPSLHFSRPNPHIAWDELPLRVPTAPVPWEEGGKRRIADVSSFGLSGTNAHVVLEEAPPETEAPAVAPAEKPWVLPLSARSAPALEALASAWSEALKSPVLNAPLEAIAHTAGTRRSHHEHRLAITGSTRAEWVTRLEAFLRGAAPAGLSSGHAEPGAPAKVVFIFPGQGSQWIGMGRELMASEPIFREAITACAEAFRPYAQFSLLEVLQSGVTGELERIDVIQPVLFAIEVALAKLWRSWGVEPAAVVGHSMGEVAAAHVAGALSLEDAARVICERSKLMLRLRGAGAMAVVELPAEDVEAALGSERGRVSIAASNSPRSTVLSGETSSIDELVKRYEAQGVFARRVKVDVASHSAQVDPILAELRGRLTGLQPRAGTLPILSTVTRELTDGASFDAGYWVRNLRDPVHFSHAIGGLHQRGHTLFLEISPHPILLAAVEQILQGDKAARALPSLRRERPERASLLESLATLYTRGYALDWRKLHTAPLPCVELPTYPWQRERLWVSRPARQGTAVDVDTSSVRPLAGDRLLTPGEEIHFVRKVGVVDMPYLEDHRVFGEVVVPGAFHLATLLSVSDELVGPDGCVVESMAFAQALVLPEKEVASVHLTAMPLDSGRMRIRRASLAPQQGRAGAWRDHATATLAPLGSARAAEASVHPGRALASEHVSEVDTATFYAGVRSRGIELGPSFQWIRKLWVAPREALALLEAPASLRGPKLPVHPARMDAVFQTCAAAVPDSSATAFVPFGLDRLVFHGAPEGAWWCHATCRPEEGGDLWTGDVRLYAQDGRAIAHLEGLRFKRASPEAFLQRDKDKPAWTGWLFEQRWERQSAPLALSPPATPGRWLLFADRAGTSAGLAAKLSALGEVCITVTPGLRFERLSGTEYTVALESAGDFARVLAAAQEGGPLRGVVFLWGLDCEPPSETGLAWLADAEARGCGGLLYVVQALASGSFRDPPRLTVVTRGAQSMSGGAPVAVTQAVLWGMARSLAHEQDVFGCARIDLDPSGEAGAPESLAGELIAPDGEEEVLLRGAGRHVGRFSRCTEPGTAKHELQVRGDASYLITGGLGGLGLSVARWLVGQGARHLVLVSRGGARTPGQSEALAALKELGAEVALVQADVADPAQLSRAVDEAKRQAPLRGVIHAAGVLDDGLVAQQTLERLRRVMAPKAAGAWNLHTLTHDLDFFVLYSSAASLVGSPGQSNYSAANAFLDALAWHRRAQGLPALSINWGAFSDVGLAAQQENRGERLSRRGFGALSPDEGLEVLARLLPSHLTQVAVTPLDARQWLEFYPRLASSKRFSESVREARRTRRASADSSVLEALRAADPKGRSEVLAGLVREQIARILRLEPSTIERQTPFKALGFDSLMGLELRNHLESSLGLTLSATLVWTYPNLDALVPHLLDKLGLAPGAEPPKAEAAPEPTSPELDHLTDTEAEALLEERLASLMKRL
jgi:acyl transferase domain-containing protein/acyl carrier protein